MITKEDVTLIAMSIGIGNLCEEEINSIIEEYPTQQEQDPGATWDLVVESQIYNVLNYRIL